MPKHLNTSDLFSSNPGELLHQRGSVRSDLQSDSAINSSQSFSSSQAMASQMDNSQSSSFDLFSQMMSQQQGYSQQNETSSSKFYMKYMSKPPLFQKETSSKKPTLTRRKSFQEMQELNREKAKERDDRDLINTFIAIVKECADEVKHAASCIRKDVDTNIAETTQQTAAVISRITDELSQYHRQLLNNLKTHEDHETKVKELMEIISSKDAQIELLESQLESARKDRNEHLLKAMLDMYTEQQSVTRQHLEKVHEGQQSIKEQQSKLLEETEKSHATLSKVTAIQKPAMAGGPEPNHPGEQRDGVSSMASGAAIPRSRHLSGMAWDRDVGPSRVMPSHQVLRDACPNSGGMLPYYNQPHPTYDQLGRAADSHRPQQPASEVSGLETRSVGLRSSTSHLFQDKSGFNQHANQDLLSPSNSYVMQKFLQQEVTYRVPEPVMEANTSEPPAVHYPQQQRNARNPSQAIQDAPKPYGRSSSYDKFANRFRSPNYNSNDRQLWSKKNFQKPSPVAAIAPQKHMEPSGAGTPETPAPATREKKQGSRRRQSRTHFGGRKRAKKSKVASVQPQRKSSRLSGRSNQEMEMVSSSHAVGNAQNGRSSKTTMEKSSSHQHSTSHLFFQSTCRGNDTQESEDSTVTSNNSQNSLEWDEPVVSKSNAPHSRQQKELSRKAKTANGYSTGYNNKTSQKKSLVTGNQHQSYEPDDDDDGDVDDEYSFQEETPEVPHKSVTKRPQTAGSRKNMTSTASEVFSKRSKSTYSNVSQKRPTPLQQPTSMSYEKQKTGAMEMKKKGARNVCKQTSKGAAGQRKQPEHVPKPILLDATNAYSDDDDDSSQELYFSLKLPDTNESNFWSGLMSPGVNSQIPEQVVPESDKARGNHKPNGSNTVRGKNVVSSGNKEGLKMNRKRRMILSSQEDLSRTILQISCPSKPKRAGKAYSTIY